MIIADEMSILGSIGVISQYIEISGLMEKYGIQAETIKSGKYKDTGSMFREMTDEERKILQGKIDTIHYYFINEIAVNRNMTYEQVEELATGMIYLGVEAKESGLVDEIGDMSTAEEMIKKQLNVTEVQIIEFKETPGFLESLAGVLSKPSTWDRE